jgi:hypothetical protein
VIYFVVIGPKNVAISRAGTQCFPGPESGIMEFGIFDDLAQKAGIRFGDVASHFGGCSIRGSPDLGIFDSAIPRF